MSVKHWIRPLKDGGVEFYMGANGRKMSGSVDSRSGYEGLREIFEKAAGERLPEPETKRARGGGQ